MQDSSFGFSPGLLSRESSKSDSLIVRAIVRENLSSTNCFYTRKLQKSGSCIRVTSYWCHILSNTEYVYQL